MRSSVTHAYFVPASCRRRRRQKAIETIERNATSLTQIVEDVLDISRIVSGKLRLNVQPVEFPAIVRSAIDAIAPAAEAKEIGVESVLIRRRHRSPAIRSGCSRSCGTC